jgi:peptidoglycan hydrolase-like protein with peptidoglycan-binding domain
VLALHTGRPLWRDLGPGARGEDVRAVQEELVRLGYDVTPNGVFGAATTTAVRALWARVGVAAESRLPFDRLIWLPEVSAVVSACPLTLGQAVSAGEVALGLGGGLESLALDLDGVPALGARTAVLSDVASAAVPDGGVVTDPAFLAAYAQTRTYAAHLADPSSALTVQVRLTAPVPVVAVPPSALYGLAGSGGCVLVGGTPTWVQVVASELGQSLVTADPLPGEVRVAPGEDAPACG